jgi:hypothetical protein
MIDVLNCESNVNTTEQLSVALMVALKRHEAINGRKKKHLA